MEKVDRPAKKSEESISSKETPKIRNPTPSNSIKRKPIASRADEKNLHTTSAESHVENDLQPPPPYERHESEISESEVHEALLNQTHTPFADTANVRDDGRIDIDLDSRLGRTLARILPHSRSEENGGKADLEPPEYKPNAGWSISLNIVIQVVGSRGDVQPFIALGNELQRCGHRVRLATHNIFAKFVRENGLEFYPIGGDPAELMAYMVKNPGLIPSMKTLRGGEISRKRTMIAEMLNGCWESCIMPDHLSSRPFVADAIIANPPSFAHVHCAQALGVPLHIMFTMPWTSTNEFPHPLANLRATSVDAKMANYLSYGVVQWMTWQGLADVINAWRKTLDLEPVPGTEGALLVESLKIPHTYCWSPALVPKPEDWPSHVDVCGLFFKDDSIYTPPPELQEFLESGSQPVYIGFGSIVIDDPEDLTKIILEAAQIAGVRVIISRGWSNLGANLTDTPDVFFLGDCPHEWLFTKVAAVIHHGGAGTTACGLKFGRPTTIVPFFGDQPFWGEMIATAGVGPQPIAYKLLTSHNLAEAITFCLSPTVLIAAQEIAQRLAIEKGVKTAVNAFHRNLPLERMPCDILTHLPAVWKYSKGKADYKLSSVAAEILINYHKIERKDLKAYQTKPITIEPQRWDPVTGGAASMLETSSDLFFSTTGVLTKPFEVYMASRNTMDSNTTTATNMAVASLRSVNKFNTTVFKGLMVDMPLAVTDGLRQVPRLYGDTVVEREPVRGWKSGAKVAGSSFVHGMSDGFSDLFIKPLEHAKTDGMRGFAKGVAKGSIGLPVKMASAAVGLVAYPGEGIVRSLHTVTHSRTRKGIASARCALGVDDRGRVGKEVGQRVVDLGCIYGNSMNNKSVLRAK